jgi:hydrogenase maturation protein HypF
VRAFSPQELGVLERVLAHKLNAPLTSSAGRLFDGIASLAGLRQETTFEGQAAMELEFALEDVDTYEHYPFRLDEPQEEGARPLVLNWAPLVYGVLHDVHIETPMPVISAKFHNMLAEMIVAVARRVGEEKVVFSGGCFQNKYLTERVVMRLSAEGFRPYWHQRVPPNDGGIALGQVVAASFLAS